MMKVTAAVALLLCLSPNNAASAEVSSTITDVARSRVLKSMQRYASVNQQCQNDIVDYRDSEELEDAEDLFDSTSEDNCQVDTANENMIVEKCSFDISNMDYYETAFTQACGSVGGSVVKDDVELVCEGTEGGKTIKTEFDIKSNLECLPPSCANEDFQELIQTIVTADIEDDMDGFTCTVKAEKLEDKQPVGSNNKSTSNTNNSNDDDSKKTGLLILILVVVAAVVGGALFMVVRKKKKSRNTASDVNEANTGTDKGDGDVEIV